MDGQMFIIKDSVWNGSAVIDTYYASDQGLTTKPGDTPPSTVIPGRIIDPGLLRLSMMSGGKTSGASKYSYGEIILDNTDGSLDYLAGYGFDGRAITLYQGHPLAVFPSGWTKVYTLTKESGECAWKSITLKLRSRQAELDVPFPGGIFTGANVLPAGVEGTAELAGKPKPVLLGRCRNISPVCCNTSKLIYAVSPFTGIASTEMAADLRVFDNGIRLVYDGEYASQAAMEATAPLPGRYRVWAAGGYIRLGSKPVGQLTLDAATYGMAYKCKPGKLMTTALAAAGFGSSYNAASFNTLNTDFKSACGVYIKNGESISSVLDKLCSACGAYWFFDQHGVLFVKQLKDPAGLTADYTLSAATVIKSITRKPAADTKGGLPAPIVTLLHSRNHTVQQSTAASVTPARQAVLNQEWQSTSVSTPSIKTAHPLSEELIIETSLYAADSAETTRRAGLYQAERGLIDIEMKMEHAMGVFTSVANIKPGLIIQLSLGGRYTDKKTVLVAGEINYAGKSLTATVWG